MQPSRPTTEEPDEVNRLADMVHDGMDLVGVVVEGPLPWCAEAVAVAVRVHRDQPVPLRPAREHLPPLAGAAYATVQEHDRGAVAALDDLDRATRLRAQDGHGENLSAGGGRT